MAKPFIANGPRVDAAQAAPTRRPTLLRSGGNSARMVRKDPDRPSPKPIFDPISAALGDPIFGQGHRFDWCANHAGLRHLFKRFYPRLRILVDEFGRVTDAVRREVAEKSAAISAYNAERKDGHFGYIPYVTGATMDRDAVEHAKRGGVVPMVERVTA